MARPNSSGWGIWLGASGGGVLLVLVIVLLFRVPRPPAPPAKPLQAAPSLRIRSVQAKTPDPIFSEDAALLDPTPLFLPTDWNSGARPLELPAFDRQLGQEFPPEDRLSEPQLAAIRKDPSQRIGNVVDVLTDKPPGRPLLGLGQVNRPDLLQPVSARGGRVDVFDAATGQPVYSHSLEASVRPPASDLWKPAEFSAAVDAAGLVGPVVETASSGVDEIDAFFRGYLDRSLKLGLRLSPGLYRITVGP